MNDFDFSTAGKASGLAAARGKVLAETGKAKKSLKTRAKRPAPSGKGGKTVQTDPLFASFPQLAVPGIDQKMLVDILKSLEVDLFQNQLLGEDEVIQADDQRLKGISKTNQKKSADQLKKIEDKKGASVLGQVFGWLGAILGVVLGVVLAIVSFGTGATAAGALITASIVLGVAVAILNATGGMDKMVAAFAKPISDMLQTFGMSKKKAEQISKIISQVLVTIQIVATQIALAAASGGASLGNLASELVNKIATISLKVTNFALAVNQLAGAGADLAAGAYNYEAMMDQSDIELDKGILKKIQTLIEDEKDTIKEIMQHIMASQKNMGALIKSENENRGALSDIGRPASV